MPDRFATIVTCIDGRIQQPLGEWARQHLDVDYLDTVTEPGAEAMLANAGERGLAELIAKIDISRSAHGSDTLVVAAHADCAGNPVSETEHRRQLGNAVTRLAERLPGVRIIAVYAGRCGVDCWQPELVAK